MKRAATAVLLFMAPALAFAWSPLCPPGQGVMRDDATGEGRCMPGGFGDVSTILPTILPGMIPTPWPTRAEPTPQTIPTPWPTAWPTPGAGGVMPTPQPTFAYTAPTPQPTQPLDPTAASAAYDFAATTSNACINGPSTITVTGAVDGDACVVGVPAAAIGTGVTYHCHVSAANTVTLRACKLGTTTFNPPAGNFIVRIVRP